MNLWKKSCPFPSSALKLLRHEFVIGPQRESPMFRRKARLYHCMRCKWSFLVCERQVIVLDEHGNPMSGARSSERFDTLKEGPCPGLAVLLRKASETAGGSNETIRFFNPAK